LYQRIDAALFCSDPDGINVLRRIWAALRADNAAVFLPMRGNDRVREKQADDMWLVEGPWLQRLVATVNFGDYESRMYFDRVLREAGVFKRMEEMGVRDGDTVSMYDLMFEYQD